jgi:hypothetical protein
VAGAHTANPARPLTEQRKTLLAIAAMLLMANVVALFFLNTKPTEALWFSATITEFDPPSESDEATRLLYPLERRMVVLDGDGARLGNRRVPFTAMVSNTGRAEFARQQREGLEGYAPGPWRVEALVAHDTPVSTVIAAVRQVNASCNLPVMIYSPRTAGNDAGNGRWLVIAPIGDDRLVAFSGMHGEDTTADRLGPYEPLERFGERTGCARVSPLQP